MINSLNKTAGKNCFNQHAKFPMRLYGCQYSFSSTQANLKRYLQTNVFCYDPTGKRTQVTQL